MNLKPMCPYCGALPSKGDDPAMSQPEIGDRVWDSFGEDYGTIVDQIGREWIIEWDRTTPHPGRWDTRPGKCPWFSLVKDHPLRAEVSR